MEGWVGANPGMDVEPGRPGRPGGQLRGLPAGRARPFRRHRAGARLCSVAGRHRREALPETRMSCGRHCAAVPLPLPPPARPAGPGLHRAGSGAGPGCGPAGSAGSGRTASVHPSRTEGLEARVGRAGAGRSAAGERSERQRQGQGQRQRQRQLMMTGARPSEHGLWRRRGAGVRAQSDEAGPVLCSSVCYERRRGWRSMRAGPVRPGPQCTLDRSGRTGGVGYPSTGERGWERERGWEWKRMGERGWGGGGTEG